MEESVRKDEMIISIHAPTRGATEKERRFCHFLRFQSTLPRGERPLREPGKDRNRKFQSTLPRGERRFLAEKQHSLLEFQSTLPRGERRKIRSTAVGQQDFNPRSHEGSDCGDPEKNECSIISIHAPTRGATGICLMISEGGKTFQSTLPRGERQQIYTNILTYSCKTFLKFFLFHIFIFSFNSISPLFFSYFRCETLNVFMYP